MTISLDPAALMAAGGDQARLRRPGRDLPVAVGSERPAAVISAAVVPATIHRPTAVGRREVGAATGEAALDRFNPALPQAVIAHRPRPAARDRGRPARDPVRVGRRPEARRPTEISPERGRDRVSELR